MWTHLKAPPELHLLLDSDLSSDDACLHERRPAQTVESKALQLLEQPGTVSLSQLHDLFWMLPPRLFIRGSTGGGVKHIVFGAIPRGGCLAIATLKFPAVVQVFTKFLRTVCPRHLFTTFVLRQGCFGKPHKDRRNSEDFVLLALLSEFVAGSGLWIESSGGTVSLDNKGSPAFGKVVDISKPFRFDSRNTLHAGFVPPGTDASKRVILVAFCTKFPDDLTTQLLNLGFNLPNACRTPAFNPVPRIIQLLQSPPRRIPYRQDQKRTSSRFGTSFPSLHLCHLHHNNLTSCMHPLTPTPRIMTLRLPRTQPWTPSRTY